MDFGGGFAVGIGAGMGSGIAVGASAGQKEARKKLRSYIEENGIEIHDRYGKPIKLDEFMDQAVPVASGCCSRKRLWVFLVLGTALAIGAAAYAVMNATGSF